MLYNKFLNRILDSKNYTYLLILLFLIGIIVRIVGLNIFPSGLNQDEASIGYESFSILNYGLDRNGISFPIHLISWGNGQNALYAYLSMPFIYLFGLNIFSVRIVSALFSIASLFVFYFLFKLIFDKKKALVALAFLTICPWSIMAGRWGLESNIFPTIFLTAVYCLIKSTYTNPKYLFFSFILFALSLYSYGTSYLLVPLFFAFTILYILKNIRISNQLKFYSLGAFSILALPIFLFVIINHLNFDAIKFGAFTIPRLESNRTTEIFNLFNGNFFPELVKNAIRFINITVLQTDGTLYNSIPAFGTIYPISFPFFAIGLYNVLKKQLYKKDFHHYIFGIWLLCNIILGLTSNVNINRLNSIFFPILYFTVLGIFDASLFLKEEYTTRYKQIMVVLYTTYFILFTFNYCFIHNKEKDMFCYGLGDAIHFAEKQSSNTTINISPVAVNMPYIYVCFYNKIDPELFKKTVKYNSEVKNGFRNVLSFCNYTFNSDLKKPNSIQIINKNELEYSIGNSKNYKAFGNFVVVLNK